MRLDGACKEGNEEYDEGVFSKRMRFWFVYKIDGKLLFSHQVWEFIADEMNYFEQQLDLVVSNWEEQNLEDNNLHRSRDELWYFTSI